MSKNRFLIIDSNSINNDVYFKEDGKTTRDKGDALVVDSIESGLEWAKRNFVLYEPIFQPI